MSRTKITMLSLAALVLFMATSGARAQTPDVFQVNYFAGADGTRPDQTVHITNPGTDRSNPTSTTSGDLCANIYVFRSDQQLTECCSCLVTPDGLRTLSVDFDLTHNPLTAGAVGEGVIKIVSSEASGGACALDNGRTAYTPVPALRAWGTHNQDVSGGLSGASVVNAVTETHFLDATLSPAELSNIQAACNFIFNQGSGAGKCSCGRGD